jgi:hypothetical protein
LGCLLMGMLLLLILLWRLRHCYCHWSCDCWLGSANHHSCRTRAQYMIAVVTRCSKYKEYKFDFASGYDTTGSAYPRFNHNITTSNTENLVLKTVLKNFFHNHCFWALSTEWFVI